MQRRVEISRKWTSSKRQKNWRLRKSSMYRTKFWASGGLAEIFCLTPFVLYRIRYIAALKFGGLAASRAHSSVDIAGVIRKRSIKIVFCHGPNLLHENGSPAYPCGFSTAPLPNRNLVFDLFLCAPARAH